MNQKNGGVMGAMQPYHDNMEGIHNDNYGDYPDEEPEMPNGWYY
jgi:hypothetical protein